MQKYLLATYYGMHKHQYDSQSVVKDFDRIYIPCDRGIYTKEEILKNCPEATILELQGKGEGYRCFKPVDDKRWLMKGYGFVYSCDSRFHDQYGDYPIPLHDRYER